jgi:hypothetical protein
MPAENTKLLPSPRNLTDQYIQKFLMLYFRWALPSPSATKYSPSLWNATQYLLEPMLFLLDGDAKQ